MNKVIVIGRITTDPEITYYGDDDECVTRFSLAIDRFNKDVADFPRCVAFGKTAEFIEQYFTKGMKMAIEGHIQTGTYDHKDGYTVYTTDVVVDRVEFCEKKADSDSDKKTSKSNKSTNKNNYKGGKR